jgi:hypothetical protein
MGVVMAVDDYSAPGKNFRSTYYESLGFRENEKSVSQLENCLRADVIGENAPSRDISLII